MSEPRTSSVEDVLRVETPESVAFRLELAGIGSRGLALVLDTAAIVVLVALELLAVLAVTWLLADLAGLFNLAVSLSAFGVLAFLTYWGYFVVGELRDNGRTWGKKRVGLRVVRDDGGRVSLLDSLIRNLVRVADMLPGLYGVGMVSMLVSRHGKRLGDLAAGTVVVRDREDMKLFFDGSEGPPKTALAREFLDRRSGFTPDARYQVSVEILSAMGEEAGSWDEPQVAGRLAQLSGWSPTAAPQVVTPDDSSATVNQL